MASTPQEARRLAELCVQEIERESLSIDEAIEKYETYLREDRGNKEQSCKATTARLRLFFPRQRWLVRELTPARCANLYSALVKAPSPRTGEPLRPDTHRDYLADAKTFLAWCVAQKMLRQNPLAEVRGVGRRSHGKEQLTADEARKWLAAALRLCQDEPGAVAAALLLLCGLRASEVTERLVRDVDDGGKVLRITSGKTRAAVRPVGIPEVIRPHVLGAVPGPRANGQALRPALARLAAALGQAHLRGRRPARDLRPLDARAARHAFCGGRHVAARGGRKPGARVCRHHAAELRHARQRGSGCFPDRPGQATDPAHDPLANLVYNPPAAPPPHAKTRLVHS
jgi:integrase